MSPGANGGSSFPYLCCRKASRFLGEHVPAGDRDDPVGCRRQVLEVQEDLALPFALGTGVEVEVAVRIVAQHNKANVNVGLTMQDPVVFLVQPNPSLGEKQP